MPTPLTQSLRLFAMTLCLPLVQACTVSAISQDARAPQLPEQWQAADSSHSLADIAPAWLAEFDSEPLLALAVEAQAANYQLSLAQAQVRELRAAVTSTGAARWPRLALGLDGSYDAVEDDASDSPDASWAAGLDLTWDLDIWGKLNDRQKAAELNYQAAVAGLRVQQLQLAADVANGWFSVVANTELRDLLQQRLHNVSTELQRLEQGYRRGLNQALDVYLSRNTVAESRANLAAQEQTLLEARTRLQRLLARYPDGGVAIGEERLPDLAASTPAGTPSGLLQRRPDIQRAWLDLLGADAGLAAAHKDRFPVFSLVGRSGFSSDALHKVLDVGVATWSIGAGLVQPLFEGGRLQALEEQARERVVQAEQAYLETVYNAMAEIENLLSAEQTLRRQLAAQRESRSNADIAYELSLQQYERGLVDYTTVLEAQRRAFDAQTAAISLQFQTIANRIALHRALGGDFAARPATTTAQAASEP